MIEHVNTALLEIQGALLARSLYPDGHPRIRSGEERALSLLRDVLDERREITLFAVEERVIFENEALPASANLVDCLFRNLRQRGVDRLTFRHGLQANELSLFLDELTGTGDAVALPDVTHLTFGSLQDLTPAQDRVELQPETKTDLTELAVDHFPEIWESAGEGTFDVGSLGDIVSSLSRVVSESAGAMLPLAPLKRHDEYTFVHTINVAILSTALAEALGFDGKTVRELSISALLHDVGKQAIPTEVLNKNGRFTDEEFAIMRAHPVAGARILFGLPNVPDLAPIVAYEHHIRADGTGYPKVPRGWRLNLASRIVQLADVFDALRTDRPYREGQPVSKIIEMMKHDVGSFFDADLLLVFLERVVARGVPSSA
jgi:putative nucleotidyltransferase with HDIG domain